MMELINYLGGEEVAVDKLKKKGTVYFNDTATNSSGFTALAGGMYLTLDPKINYITFPGVEQSKFAIFKNMWQGFYCWTSSPYYLMPEAFIFSIENVSINETICFPKEYGLSVRCLRDKF